MYKDKKIIGIITARGGSKGVPRKNIKDLGGKPLIAWSIEAGLNSKYIDDLIVTTDDLEIAEISKEYGANIPFMRPKELAKDETTSVDTIMHTLKNIGEEYEYFVLLQPTSPFRTSIQVDSAIEILLNDDISNSLISVNELEMPAEWIRTVDENGILNKFIDYDVDEKFQRQSFEKKYRLNGAIYIVRISEFIRFKKLELKNTIAFKMDTLTSLDIDNLVDFEVGEIFIKGGYND